MRKHLEKEKGRKGWPQVPQSKHLQLRSYLQPIKMAGPSFNFISQNIASSRSIVRITDILKRNSPDLLFLQEVTLTTDQIQTAVQGLQYKCESNVDEENPTFPGTAIIWKANLPAPEVTCLVTCNIQSIKIGQQAFYNVYAPSGSQGLH